MSDGPHVGKVRSWDPPIALVGTGTLLPSPHRSIIAPLPKCPDGLCTSCVQRNGEGWSGIAWPHHFASSCFPLISLPYHICLKLSFWSYEQWTTCGQSTLMGSPWSWYPTSDEPSNVQTNKRSLRTTEPGVVSWECYDWREWSCSPGT